MIYTQISCHHKCAIHNTVTIEQLCQSCSTVTGVRTHTHTTLVQDTRHAQETRKKGKKKCLYSRCSRPRAPSSPTANTGKPGTRAPTSRSPRASGATLAAPPTRTHPVPTRPTTPPPTYPTLVAYLLAHLVPTYHHSPGLRQRQRQKQRKGQRRHYCN